MLILGVDPGTQILGYALLQTEPKPTMVEMDVLYLKNEGDYKSRIHAIFDFMELLMQRTQPAHLAIEAPFFGKNVQSMLKLGRAQGVAIAQAIAHDIDYTEYEPATIKQHIAGNGRATKEQVQSMLEAQLGAKLDAKYLDATDALAAAYCHYLVANNPMAGVQQLLATPKRSKKKKPSWSDFVVQNPELINRQK